MSFRQVIVRDSNYLSFKDNALVVHADEHKGQTEDTKIVLEEIAIIVIENHKSTLSVYLLNKCSENNIALIICDEKMLPRTIVNSYSHHYKQLENVYNQIDMSFSRKSKIWRDIIKNKINNQALIIEQTTNNEDTIMLLEYYSDNTQKNDEDNREAIAAKVFFNEIYGSEFRRFIDNKINHALNYGYAILASSITRCLISYGLDTKFGIWHSSKGNAFNLSYDLIEPFRPLVDLYVYNYYSIIDKDLTIKIRRGLVNILNAEITYDNNRYRVQNVIDLYCKNYLNVVRSNTNTLIPVILKDVEFYED